MNRVTGITYWTAGATYFCAVAENLEATNAVVDADESFSLVGAAALRAGLVRDSRILHSDALVLKPLAQYNGPVDELGRTGEPLAGAGV